MTIEKLLDVKTCANVEKEKLLNVLQSTLKEKKSSLNNCMEQENIKNLMLKDFGFQEYVGSVYSKYLKLVDQITDETNPLKILCHIDDPKKMGAFDESTTPYSVSLNIEQLKKSFPTEPEFSKALQNTLNHEIFHFGAQMQSPNKNFPNCVDEKFADLFTKLCDPTVVIKNIPSSDEIDGMCRNPDDRKYSSAMSSDTSFASSSTGSKSGITGDVQTTGGLGNALSNANTADQQTKTQANIAKTVTQADFTKVSDSNLTTLLSNTTAGTKEGQPYTVSSNSDFGNTVQNTMNAFVNSGNTLTAKLNTAVAATTTTAQAKTSTTTTTPTTVPTSSTYVPTTIPTGTTATNTQPTTTTTTNSRMPAGVDNSNNFVGTTGKQVSTPGVSEMGGGQGGQTGTIPSNNTVPSTVNGKVTAPVVSAGGGSDSSGGGGGRTVASIPQQTALQKKADGEEVMKTIRALNVRTSMTGGQYQEIKKYYNNQTFKNLLQVYDMRIVAKDASGKNVVYGATGKAKRVFTDDGQVLKTVDEK